eukprot:GFUD01002595.1.p1 GENE.GFUD01002595.1~~GFUD01002595.1.p1  ORF type:complete len:480 (-),score=128.99 GFUD01002595.1:302-1741(-)
MVGMEDLSIIVKRLEEVTERLEAIGENYSGDSKPVTQAEKLTISVTAYDDIYNGTFKAFLENCDKIGSEVATAAPLIDKAFKAQREFLRIASQAKAPSAGDLNTLLKPLGDIIGEIQDYRERMRRCDYFNHLSALSEAIPALGWVTVSPAPAPFVLEMNHAGQFYTNRVLKDWKEKSHVHVEWVKSWLQTLTELQAYVKQFHTTGLVWNKNGDDALAVSKTPSEPKPTAGAPPPGPPPPPPPPAPTAENGNNGIAKSGRNELLESLNQGNDITNKLKKVTEEEMTHKNPALRSDGIVKAKEPSATAKQPSTTSTSTQGCQQARTELDGKRWNVEFHKDNKCITIADTEPHHSVYIYKCEGSTIQVGGKCNNIILDQCKKTGIVFQSAVSGIEFINCQSMQIQVLGSVPTISVDKTDGCQMFLSKDCMDVNIITAKSSEMNVMIPNGDEFVEQPLPEQFRTTVHGLKLETFPTDWNCDLV